MTLQEVLKEQLIDRKILVCTDSYKEEFIKHEKITLEKFCEVNNLYHGYNFKEKYTVIGYIKP